MEGNLPSVKCMVFYMPGGCGLVEPVWYIDVMKRVWQWCHIGLDNQKNL